MVSVTASASSEEQSITVVHTFDAPVAEVFAAWTDPALMREWLVPHFCKISEISVDPQPGGSYRIVIVGPFGGKHITTGEYREVVPNKRLVQTWVLEGQSRAVDAYPTLLSVDFRELGPHSTEITLRQEQLRTRADRSGNLMGWRLCFKKLDKLLRRKR